MKVHTHKSHSCRLCNMCAHTRTNHINISTFVMDVFAELLWERGETCSSCYKSLACSPSPITHTRTRYLLASLHSLILLTHIVLCLSVCFSLLLTLSLSLSHTHICTHTHSHFLPLLLSLPPGVGKSYYPMKRRNTSLITLTYSFTHKHVYAWHSCKTCTHTHPTHTHPRILTQNSYFQLHHAVIFWHIFLSAVH